MGGTSIAASTWQPDATPYMTWTVGAWPNPISGYSFVWDAAANCTIDTTQTAMQFTTLSEGTHVFHVRAIDNMASCGAETTFTLLVDSMADTVSGLSARTQ